MRSARILLTTLGSLGDLHPYLAVAQELQRRGHRPLILTLPLFREWVEAAGLEFRPLNASAAGEAGPELIRRVLRSPRGVEFLIRRVVMPALCAAHAETLAVAADPRDPAALLMTHPLTMASRVVAEQLGVPWVSTQLAPFSMGSGYDPPVFPGLGWIYRALAGRERTRVAVNRAVLRSAARLMRPWFAPYFRLREGVGLPRGRDPMVADPHSPWLELALFSPLLGAPQPDWPAQTVQTGFPCFAQPENESTRAQVALLDRFLHAGTPPIVFTLGSAAVMDPGTFFPESLAAARMLGRRAVLLGAAPAAGGMDEPDVLRLGFAPYHRVFPFGAVVVHQGGIGTTAEALRSGRPSLVAPFGIDQPDNAARVVRLGAGLALPIRGYTAVAATRLLERLLAEPSFLDRASLVGQQMRQEDGATRAADALEQLLEARTRLGISASGGFWSWAGHL